MSESGDPQTPSLHSDWPLRPWGLALLLGLAGLGVYFVAEWDSNAWAPWRAALTAALVFGSLSFAFTIDRSSWKEPLAFAAIVALIMAGIAWRVALASETHVDAPFWFAAGIVAIALALPLFQAGFHRLRWRTSYDETHFHVWTDAICVAGAQAFVGLSWLLLFLLAQLFAAIKIDVLKTVIDQGWFGWTFSGAAFGAALGVLRNQLKIIGTLQSVVMLVFSIIAVPLAIALAIFLLAVVASGISVLWNATESPTPLLLSFAVACFVLVNAVVRNDDAEASANRVLRWAALVLALAIFPLAVLAALSTGTRIAEYGLSPERIWGVIAVAVAVAYGVAYFIAPIRGRMAGWMDRVRTANMHLAVGTCVLAFMLALPLFDFGAISVRNQLARLDSGTVAVDDFDFDALRWDFGDAGRDALARLAKRSGQVGELAQAAAARQSRYYGRTDPDPQLRMTLDDPALESRLQAYVRANSYSCFDMCIGVDLGEIGGIRQVALLQGNTYTRLIARPDAPLTEAPPPAQTPSISADSPVEVRPIERRYIVVDGQPFGPPID